MTRIQNYSSLLSHGNTRGRQYALDILDAGLDAADPLPNMRKLLRLQQRTLVVGFPDFEPAHSPITGEAVYDLSKVNNIYVFGAGKGIQRVAQGIEELLGDYLTGGHVIDKKGYPVILKRIGVTLGSHPVPDVDCVRGCERILEMTQGLQAEDLVFLCTANGVSSLLTMPVPGVSVEDVKETTYLMQVERGAPTGDLNPIRNHLDMMKGGRITKHVHPARMIHVLAWFPSDYHQLMYRNLWLHTLPDYTTFQHAVNNLKKWRAWDTVPESVRQHLKNADPQYETVKATEFAKMSFRIFGVMPRYLGMIEAAKRKAQQLGLEPFVLTQALQAEASQAGLVVAYIAKSIEQQGEPFRPPCVLLTGGELLVTVGSATGVGGRNQEFVLTAAHVIAKSPNIVMAAADTDGTDGPGTQFVSGVTMPCLAGGIVDGNTLEEAQHANIDIRRELRAHNSSVPLWRLKNGIITSKNISMNDLSVTVILEKNE